MSWVKKRGHPAATTAAATPPPVQMYNPNQHSNQENQWQQQAHDNWYSQQQSFPPKQETKTQPNYWQQPYQQQQAYNQNSQQYGHYQEYYQNNTPYQQQPYANMQYNQQYNAQNNLYGQPPQQQTEGDGWGSNWGGWEDEDNSNVQAPAQPTTNLVTDSFANDKSWNWTVDEAASAQKSTNKAVKPETENDTAKLLPSSDKRNKLETPQWSVESQMSQESSDDILQTSESDKSRMLSRSSTISHSPVSGQDMAPGNHLDTVQIKEEPDPSDYLHFENKEILSHVVQDTPPPPPPTSVVGLEESKANPYKRNATLSHKFRGSNTSTNLFQPTFGQSVNLETLPDNSEQPDSVVPAQPPRKAKPWAAENNEAPINDRDQYLETAQLSDVDFNRVSEAAAAATADNDALPPPGLRRMVLGRVERQENNQAGADEPPLPSFSRMVPGQLEAAPEDFRRMVPGESSSPESNMRQQYQAEPEDSEPEPEVVPTRSATIGADTPPTNRSETIGADTSPSRREEVEGQIQDADVGALVSSVRSLTVTEAKKSDGGDASENRRSSDSEHDARVKSPAADRRRYHRDKEETTRTRGGRYSPPADEYREKKYDRRRYHRDRRYEEDTDYYSDKERRHRGAPDDREYDRKYGSLRKDKDKERERRRRDDRREYGRDQRKNDYYYGRYEDEFENESRSRASSRSDSVHDSYRDRGHHDRDGRRDRRHHRDKDKHRRHRDPFNPYAQAVHAQGFGYDIYSQYYQQLQYYENLRKTNPQAYAQLYRKYYQDASGEAGYGGEDRASVHSGRSSANDELAKDRYTRQSYYSQTSLPHLGGYYRGSQTHSISGQYGLDDSSFVRTLDQTDNSLNYEDPHLAAQRLTPAKFATAHTKASIASGKMVMILPHYPLDGQTPTVELRNFESLLHNDDDFQELRRFPGPLVKGTTHKKTIIEYCESKIRDAAYNQNITDRESYVLMWELLILLIRQNGMVVGADIAELLLKNRPQEGGARPPSVVSSVGSNVEGSSEAATATNHQLDGTTNLREEEVTNKFREYLLYGSGKEALEWAMKHGLWGHALFLASKLDKRTYANVLMRFANGLAMNDPLQTLYQMLSGRTPAAVTCVADEKWGDWRPHLAMILSNSTQRPELNCKAITILGDTLMGRGSLYAAQFCYLMAEVGFGNYDNAEAKMVLLGSNHHNSFAHFATNEAIHMTEIYEYARSLNDDEFALVSFQRYKYLLSTRLADVGLLEKALSYLEKIANFVIKHPGAVDAALVNDVYLLADRLKYYDPVGEGEDDDNELDSSRASSSWLTNLKRIRNDYNMGLISQENNVAATYPPTVQEDQVYNQDMWQQQRYDQYQQPQVATDSTQIEYKQQTEQQQQEGYPGQYQEQQQYWPGQQQWNSEQTSIVYHQDVVEPQQQQQLQNYYGSIAQSEDIPTQPQISLPNQREERNRKESLSQNEQVKQEVPSKSKAAETVQQSKPTGNGWFGGIFSKLSFKPNNQMKLPDDKNPTILWDPEKKRWVNTEDENGDGASDFKPPPKMSEMMPKPQMAPQSFAPIPKNPEQQPESTPKVSQPNIFKLQKGRNLKKSYIDVFNPNSKPGQLSSLPPPAPLAGMQTTPAPMNFFVPQPVNDPNAPTDFLTPAPPLQYDENAQMSRWSSASSLSREVQSYTMHKPNPRR